MDTDHPATVGTSVGNGGSSSLGDSNAHHISLAYFIDFMVL